MPKLRNVSSIFFTGLPYLVVVIPRCLGTFLDLLLPVARITNCSPLVRLVIRKLSKNVFLALDLSLPSWGEWIQTRRADGLIPPLSVHVYLADGWTKVKYPSKYDFGSISVFIVKLPILDMFSHSRRIMKTFCSNSGNTQTNGITKHVPVTK